MGLTSDQVQVDQVLSVLQQRGTPCRLEEVAGLCPELTAAHVFLAIGYVIRSRQICLTLDINSRYCVKA